jgi:hypothetical protein
VITELELHATMGQALVERGLATTDQVATDRAVVEARLAGTPQPAPAGAAPAAQAAPSALQPGDATPVDPLDAAIFKGPETPDGYKFAPLPDGVQPAPVADVAAIKTTLHEFGVAPEIAREIDRQYVAAALKPPTAADIDATRQQTMQALHRMHGDDAGKVLATAQREFRAMVAKQPRLADMAEQSGLGNSFYVIQSLYSNARAKGRA